MAGVTAEAVRLADSSECHAAEPVARRALREGEEFGPNDVGWRIHYAK